VDGCLKIEKAPPICDEACAYTAPNVPQIFTSRLDTYQLHLCPKAHLTNSHFVSMLSFKLHYC
jgi:hypothetical protein